MCCCHGLLEPSGLKVLRHWLVSSILKDKLEVFLLLLDTILPLLVLLMLLLYLLLGAAASAKLGTTTNQVTADAPVHRNRRWPGLLPVLGPTSRTSDTIVIAAAAAVHPVSREVCPRHLCRKRSQDG
jgi:hypothetical protein